MAFFMQQILLQHAFSFHEKHFDQKNTFSVSPNLPQMSLISLDMCFVMFCPGAMI